MSFSAREDLIAYRWTISDDVGVDVQENVQQRGVTCHQCVCVRMEVQMNFISPPPPQPKQLGRDQGENDNKCARLHIRFLTRWHKHATGATSDDI